ncbi:FecCD family ABC transporter permease [Arenibaculum pallidiluteum]|uniref:FecCD family ABC transporter permease n=1 Tax=Arenibaculum pallidiluteum TaxID=2812559 RepID=UPI001A96D98B|nr:iron chelate uptake ABC transporter family permease subunit [Arenibaculum pallidiluteum]
MTELAEGVQAAGSARYRALVRRRILLLGALALALCLSLLVDVSTGPASYPLPDVLRAILSPSQASAQLGAIVWAIRMPSALMAAVVGLALSVAGGQMQTILNNPLASPFTLGISAAASFGAALTIAFGITLVPVAADYAVPANAFAVAMLTALAIHALSLRRDATVHSVVLLGIALVFTFNALLAMVQFVASDQAVAAVVFWTMGSLTKATWPKLAVTVAAICVAVPVFVLRRWSLTALRMGEARAASFGIRVRRLRLETLMLVALLAAVPVSFVGTIGFIGLVGPHIARMLIGEDQRFFLPATALCGALIMSLSSIVAKTLIPGAIIPIGIVTSLVGIPLFFFLILRNGRPSW